MGNKSREAKRERLRQIVQMRRAHGAESDWSALIGEAARSLGALPAPPPLPGLSEPLLGLPPPVSPQMSRRFSAVGSGVNSKSRAWGWICEQIFQGASPPEWLRRPLAGHLGSIFADLFHMIGGCRLPIFVGPTAASQLFARRKTITDLRIEKRKWVLASDDPQLKEYF